MVRAITSHRPLALSSGFTLVEVLIAATILFGSIAVIAEAYRSSVAAARKASTTANMLAPLPFILSVVEQHLKESAPNPANGSGAFRGTRFSFKAKPAVIAAPIDRTDIDVANSGKYGGRFVLYQVDLELTAQGAARRFQYRELAWTPLVAK